MFALTKMTVSDDVTSVRFTSTPTPKNSTRLTDKRFDNPLDKSVVLADFADGLEMTAASCFVWHKP